VQAVTEERHSARAALRELGSLSAIPFGFISSEKGPEGVEVADYH
jgi:hypothetical protein